MKRDREASWEYVNDREERTMKNESKDKYNLPRGLWWRDTTGRIALCRCPKCGRENYCMNVLSGICTWCGFDANSYYNNDNNNNNNEYEADKQ